VKSKITTLAILAILGIGCGDGDTPEVARHTVRAEIVKLPDPPGSEVFLRHEAIPDFRDATGRTVGMTTMTMPFALGPGVRLDGYAPGDRIEVDFEVRWSGSGDPLRIVRVERLPPGTRLEFDPAPDPGAAP
jgi:Cu/Ag efflux protein CusF